MTFPKPYWMPLAALLLLVPLSLAGAADAPGLRSQDSVKKRIEREKTFLLRSSEDMGRTVTYVNETIALLKEQLEAAANREPRKKARERVDILEWYQKYADWLTGMSSEIDLEVSNIYARQQPGAGWVVRYGELEKGVQKLAQEIGRKRQKLESEKHKLEARMKKLNKAVAERRVLVDRDDLELARELWPVYRDNAYDRREAIYKDLSEDEVLYCKNELRSLGEEQNYFENLSELAKYEETWLLIKTDEFGKLHEVARAVGGDEPGPMAYAVRGVIRIYEADRAALKRTCNEIDAGIQGISRTGTLGTLDRMEDLSRTYEKMKRRYERHGEWLANQIGAYQADLVELGKEL